MKGATLRTTGIRIANHSPGKQIAGRNTQVLIVRADDQGNEELIDISSFVTKVDAKLHVGEIITARLECFITGVETDALLSDLVLRKPRAGFWRRLRRTFRDFTTLGSPTREYAR